MTLADLAQMYVNDPDWTAPRHGQDWRDDELMIAVAWLKSFVPHDVMERRLEAAKAFLLASRKKVWEGDVVPLFDTNDTVAWYILQAQSFATDRRHWTPEGVMRVVPFLTRLGKEMPLLLKVKGVEERAARMMNGERRQPDGALFELLVGLAYQRGNWSSVEFVPEMRTMRTPDLHVSRPGSRWAVECKRLSPSLYAQKEKAIGEELAAPVHKFCESEGISIVVEVVFKIDISEVPASHLLECVRGVADNLKSKYWNNEVSFGYVKDVNWPLLRRVMSIDDVYYGSSRMIELLSGKYNHNAYNSMRAKWRPSRLRPEYADAIYQASAISWRCVSDESMSQRAKHFKRTLANAEEQLPADRPGVIHIGIESEAGSEVDRYRHLSNSFEARFFQPKKSRLRWVYGNYFVPEATTRKNESWAITETMVPYKIGRHRTAWPLPNHALVAQQGQTKSGVHW